MLKVTRSQALAWRLRRHLLDPLGRLSAADVVERLCGVQAQVVSAAELAVAMRGEHPEPSDVGRALAEGRIIRTWAMRGALHLLEPRQGAAFLALIAHARPWARPSWQRAFGMTPKRIEGLREAAGTALEGNVLTRDELIRAIVARPGFQDLEAGLRSGWGTLLKPLAWQGELCYGPSRDQRVTFMRPADASPTWPGLPDPDAAAAVAIDAWLGTHGPAAFERFGGWMAGGFFGQRQLRAWFAAQGDRLARVDVDGEEAWMRAADVADLEASQPSDVVRLLPGFDQWVLAPGTADRHVVPPSRRSLVSRQSGWISPVVVSGGVVAGTWELRGKKVAVGWFREAGRVPAAAVSGEVVRLADIVRHDLAFRLERVHSGVAGAVLSQRHLNRALLARQLLLERSGLSIPEAVAQVGGLQTQYAPSGYVGLWTRLAGFRRDDFTRALEERTVVQATLMRVTIHVVSAREYWRYAEGVREARRTWLERVEPSLDGAAMDAAAGRVRAALAEGPRDARDLGDLGSGFLGRLGVWVDLVRVPPSGTWERRRADRLALADRWLGPSDSSPSEGLTHLVAAYLRAFGPAAWRDIASWAGIGVADAKRAGAELQLVTYRDEQGRELFDLPAAPLPDPDTAAPVRFLPHWDANLLVHARRTGLLPEEHRSRVFATRNPFSVGTILVDGRVVAAWSSRDGRIVVDRFEPLSKRDQGAVEEERRALEDFQA